MRNALAVVSLCLTGCLAAVPDHEVLPPSDAGLPDAGVWVCGPGACDGCCDEGRCLPGNRLSACGHGGAACAACGADAHCGPMNACEPLDPDRYGGGNPNEGQPSSGTGSTCRTINGAYVCW